MTSSFKTPSTYIPAAFLFALTACGGSRPQKSETATPAPSTEEARASDSVLSAPEDRPAAPGASNKGATERESPAEESADLDESGPTLDSGEQSSAEPDESGPKQEKKSRTPLGELELQVLDFNESMKAEALSCDGARPQMDSICAIAERICEMEGPSTTKSSDCSRAKESCERAKKQFQQKCG